VESDGERILKIGQYLAVMRKSRVSCFLTHGVLLSAVEVICAIIQLL